MMRSVIGSLLLTIVSLTSVGCGGGDKPGNLSPDEEQQLLQQIEANRRAEGAAQAPVE